MEDYDFFKKKISDIGVFKELQCFQLLYNDEIVGLLVEESNNYYRKILIEKYGNDYRDVILNSGQVSTYPHLYVTRGIEKEDVIAFIGVRIYMGLHKYPTLEDYWNKDILYKNILKEIMPKNYYFLLAKALHFPEKEKKKDDCSQTTTEGDSSSCENNNIGKIDPRYKINLYLEKLAQNFQKYYDLGENITIDESLIQFKGRNSMKFYIPMKPHKWGFKIHLLCDADTHYLYNMLFDPGRGGKNFICSDDCASLSESIVLKLLSCIKDTDKKKRNVFFDGWYSSISLMKKLTKLGFLNTTVLRANSKELPPKIKLEGYDKAYSDQILIQKYEGKKTILFATNYKIDKEELRNIYNIKNRGVDTFDQLLAISSSQRRTKKWYKKVFLFGIDATVINAKIIFESKTGKSLKTVKFKENLVRQIFKMYMCSNRSNTKMKYSRPYKFKFTNTHSIERVDEEKVCKSCNRNASHMCIECNIHLHPDCFEQYHRRFVYRANPPPVPRLPYQPPIPNPGTTPAETPTPSLNMNQDSGSGNPVTGDNSQTNQNNMDVEQTPTASMNQDMLTQSLSLNMDNNNNNGNNQEQPNDNPELNVTQEQESSVIAEIQNLIPNVRSEPVRAPNMPQPQAQENQPPQNQTLDSMQQSTPAASQINENKPVPNPEPQPAQNQNQGPQDQPINKTIPPPEPEQKPIPATQPEPTHVQIPEPEPPKIPKQEPQPQPMEIEKSEPKIDNNNKKPEIKPVEDKKPEPKITEDKQKEIKKMEDKKTESKQVEEKKPENKSSEEKKSEPKQIEDKKPENKSSEEKKSEPKQIEDKKPENKSSEEKKSEPKQIEDKKPENKSSEEKKTEPKTESVQKSEPKQTKSNDNPEIEQKKESEQEKK